MAKRKNRRGCGAVVVFLVCGLTLYLSAPKREAVTNAPTLVATVVVGGPTATITNTPTATATPLPSSTPAPTATPKPEDQAQAIIHEAVALADINSVSVIDVGSPKLLAVEFNMMQGFSGYEVDFTAKKMLEMACALYQNGFAQDWQYQFSAMVDLIDRSTGKTSTDDGLTVRVKSGTVAGWDCSNAILMDAKLAVDDYILNPVMTR